MQSGAPVNSLRSDKPCAPLNNISLPLRFSADSSKVISPGVSFPRKCTSTVRSASCAFQTEVLPTKQAENAEVARLRTFRLQKPSGRALLLEAIYSLTSVLKKLENSPISTKILRGWRMARGAFGRGLVKLKVPDTDVRAGGALV